MAKNGQKFDKNDNIECKKFLEERSGKIFLDFSEKTQKLKKT